MKRNDMIAIRTVIISFFVLISPKAALCLQSAILKNRTVQEGNQKEKTKMENTIKDVLLAITSIMFIILFITAIIGIAGFAPQMIAMIEPFMLPALMMNMLMFFVSIS